MTWLVTGATGQLGIAFRQAITDDIPARFTDRRLCDLSDSSSLAACLECIHPTVIINCAAYTAVDNAEDDETSAMRINATAVGEMARWAREHDALLVHFSTDYVFDGATPGAYVRPPINPMSAYGRSKATGERLFRITGQRLCLRTSWCTQ